MSPADARAEAEAMLRRRLAKGWSRQAIESTVFEGASGPGRPGYLMSAGRLSFPFTLRHDEAEHTFRLRELLDDIESPQGGLFA